MNTNTLHRTKLSCKIRYSMERNNKMETKSTCSVFWSITEAFYNTQPHSITTEQWAVVVDKNQNSLSKSETVNTIPAISKYF